MPDTSAMSHVHTEFLVDAPRLGLARRMLGVLLSPGMTYREIAARPRVLGALVVTVGVMVACQAAFMSTPLGRDLLLETQIEAIESFGVVVTDQMYERMEAGLAFAPYFGALSQVAILPALSALFAAIVLGLFNLLLGGSATFKQAYAVLAHSGVVLMVQQLFSTPLNYARGAMSSPTRLAVFAPQLPVDGLLAGFLSAIDLFLLWWLVNVAIGVAVLYRRNTGPVVAMLFAMYAVVALVIAIVL